MGSYIRRGILAAALIGVATGANLKADDAAVTAEQALTRLKAGNRRFVDGASEAPQLDQARRQVLAGGQHPFATVLSCADSRVPPEHVFNTGLGELFVVRAAGEVVDKSILASVEYATEHLHTPLLVVMGHEICGAVKASIDNPASMGPNLDYMLKQIRPAVERSAGEADRVRAAILANVEQVINDALAGSAILRHLVAGGKLQVVGGYYELSTGRVLFSKPVTAASLSTSAH